MTFEWIMSIPDLSLQPHRRSPRTLATTTSGAPRVTGIRVRLPDALHQALKTASVREDRNLKDLLGEIARMYLLRRHPDLLRGRDASEIEPDMQPALSAD
jgi:hypothetical protein